MDAAGGTVNNHVNMAGLRAHRVKTKCAAIFVGEIGAQASDVEIIGCCIVGQGLCSLAISNVDRINAIACSRQRKGSGFSDAPGTTGNQGHFYGCGCRIIVHFCLPSVLKSSNSTFQERPLKNHTCVLPTKPEVVAENSI